MSEEKKDSERPRIKVTRSRFTEFYRKKYMSEFGRFKKVERAALKEEEKKIEEMEQRAIEKTLKISIKEGGCAAATGGFGDSYISPFLVAMQASNLEISALTAVPSLIAPLSQLATHSLMRKKRRKTIVVTGAFIQSLMWIPIIILSWLFMKGYVLAAAPLLLIFFWTIYASFGNLLSPAWSSLMGDLVPEDKRGRYFGIRNTATTLVSLIATLVAGLLLDYSTKMGIVFISFAAIFSIAMLCRLVSTMLLRKHYEPEFKFEDGYYFSFLDFVKKIRGNNFGRFTIYIMLLVLATNIAGPFFTPYVLRQLHFSYLQYTIAMLVFPAIITMLTMPLWGKFSDKYGNVKTIKLTWMFVSILPLLWLVSGNFYYILFVPQIISAFGWAGFNLAAGNFIFDSTTRQRRGLCFAYYSVLNGMGVFLGATIGGLITYFGISFMNLFFFLFVLSGILRILASVIMLPRIKEVRKVEETRGLLKIIHPFSSHNKHLTNPTTPS